MKLAILIGVLIAIFVFSLPPNKATVDGLTLTFLLSLVAGLGYIIYYLRKDQNITQ